MDFLDERFKKLILQLEISAVLHDVGKYSEGFLDAGMDLLRDKKGKKINPTKAHTGFYVDSVDSDLKNTIFETPLPTDWGILNNKQFLKYLGDFISLHHSDEKKLKKHYGIDKITTVEDFLPIILMIISDTLDSSTAKGKAGGNDKNPELIQDKKYFYLATPFGQKEYCIKEEIDGNNKLYNELQWQEFKENSKKFQTQLNKHLLKIFDNNLTYPFLVEIRNNLFKFLKDNLSSTVAETRLPTNDVTLWQHLYTSGSIFKALMARHILLKSYSAWEVDEKERISILYYPENLCYLAICWDQYELLSKSYRPAEIRGRINILEKAKREIQNFIEVDLCIGNKFYEDRNGIYFLIPSFEEDKKLCDYINKYIIDKVGLILNNKKYFWGDLSYEIWKRDINTRLLEFSKLLFNRKDDSNNVLIASGPKKPLWVDQWGNTFEKEICPHCGLRPIDKSIVTGGSEQDNICAICSSYKQQATIQEGFGRRVYSRKTIEELIVETEKEDSKKRVALISMFFNLQPFLSGEAFSNIIVEPIWKNQDVSKLELILDKGKFENEDIEFLRDRILKSSFFGMNRDGSVPGSNSYEKAKNYLEQIVLNSPYSSHIRGDGEKIINFSSRLHPAPSRLTRMWNTTSRFLEHIRNWGERNKIPYTPLSIDSGSLMFLMKADDNLWQFCMDTYNEYYKSFGRVRHLLPFHMSISIFYYKSPLYVAIDASKRFMRNAMQIRERLWTVKNIERGNEEYKLELIDHRDREIRWKIPLYLPNGREDYFYCYFWVEGKNKFPLHVSELNKGSKIYVFPSTFDYEILDSTIRRYDIRLTKDVFRPHMFCRKKGPRPYPLSVWEKWGKMRDVLNRVEQSQRKHLVEEMGYIHLNWAKYDSDSVRYLCEDLINVTFKDKNIDKKEELVKMAYDGSLFDLIEWNDFICKN